MPDTVRVPTPDGVSAVLVHPDLHVNTAHARRGLKKSYTMQEWIAQQGLLAGFIVALATGDRQLLGNTLKDILIEPQRKDNVPCFDAVKDAALKAGAFGCSLSGSGPSMFALAETGSAANIASAMEQACRTQGIACESWVSSLTAPGAHVEAA